MRTNEPHWYLFQLPLVCHPSPSLGPLGSKFPSGHHEPTSYCHSLPSGSYSPLLPPCPIFVPYRRKSFCCGRFFVSLACMLRENSNEIIKSNSKLTSFTTFWYHVKLSLAWKNLKGLWVLAPFSQKPGFLNHHTHDPCTNHHLEKHMNEAYRTKSLRFWRKGLG